MTPTDDAPGQETSYAPVGWLATLLGFLAIVFAAVGFFWGLVEIIQGNPIIGLVRIAVGAVSALAAWVGSLVLTMLLEIRRRVEALERRA